MLKFGGTSVGTPESILRVKAIVEAAPQPIIVVVSALSGVTDALIALAECARQGSDAYRQSLDELRQRHHRMAESVIEPAKCAAVTKQMDALIDELSRQSAPVVIMPTYSAMMELRGNLAERYGLREFWE